MYYPGTPSFSEAQSITLAVGTEASADFQISPIRSARVSGIVFNASGAPVQAMVQLVSEAIGIGASIESAGAPPAFMINADTNAGRPVHDRQRAAGSIHAHSEQFVHGRRRCRASREGIRTPVPTSHAGNHGARARDSDDVARRHW